MTNLSHSKALNARGDFDELDPTGVNTHVRKMHHAYCVDPNGTTRDALLAAIDGLRAPDRVYLRQALRC